MIETVNKKISDLIPATYNPRKISDKEMQDLKKSISEFGIVEPIIINSNPERLNIVISGHQRLKVCKLLKMQNIPVVELNLSEDREKELNIRMNRAGGDFDFDLLVQNFSEVELLSWGFEEVELDFDDIPIVDASDKGDGGSTRMQPKSGLFKMVTFGDVHTTVENEIYDELRKKILENEKFEGETLGEKLKTFFYKLNETDCIF